MKHARAELLGLVAVGLVELLAAGIATTAPPRPRSRSPPRPGDDAPRRRTAMAFISQTVPIGISDRTVNRTQLGDRGPNVR